MTDFPLLTWRLAFAEISPPGSGIRTALYFDDRGVLRRFEFSDNWLPADVLKIGSTWKLWLKADGSESLVHFQEAAS